DSVGSSVATLVLHRLRHGLPGYAARTEGGVRKREGAYHEGTVWPWLTGPFVEAWIRVRGGTSEAKRAARERFLAPLLRHLDEAGLGPVSQIAGGDPPHTPRGRPFQALAVGELPRVMYGGLRGGNMEPINPGGPNARQPSR